MSTPNERHVMGVLVHWSDEKVAQVAERLGTPTPVRRDDVRRVLNEADAVPRDLYKGAVEENERLRKHLLRYRHPDDIEAVARGRA